MGQRVSTANKYEIQRLTTIRDKLLEAQRSGMIQDSERKVKKHTPMHLLVDGNILAERHDGNFDSATLQLEADRLNLVMTNRQGNQTIRSYLCKDESYPSYSLLDLSPSGHISRLTEAMEMWVNRYKLGNSIAPRCSCLKDWLEPLSRERGVTYQEAYLVNKIPKHSFVVGDDGVIHVALAYVIARGGDNKWNVFFHAGKEFEIVDDGGPLSSNIERFNAGGGGASVTNFLQILVNSSSQEYYFQAEDNKKYRVHAEQLDQPPPHIQVDKFPWEK